MYTFWVVKHQSNTFFDYFVCNSMGSSPAGASPTGSTSTTIYILMHNFIISYRAGFILSLLKKSKKLSLIWYQTYLDMWSIFGVKLNYIVIFEKSCNSSTLLMELFMIWDPCKIAMFRKYPFFTNHWFVRRWNTHLRFGARNARGGRVLTLKRGTGTCGP